MCISIFLRTLLVLLISFFVSAFKATAEDFYITCYYNDTNENRNGKNPELMWPSKAYLGASQNYYWALNSDSSFSGYTKLTGKIVDGFFIEEKLTYEDISGRCNIAIERGTTLWPSQKTYKLYDFKASTSNFTGFEYPIQFANDKSSKYKINKVVVFGDSLSDTGNFKRWTKIWPYYPYWYGRFSDGFIWTDYFARNTHLPIFNFAYGGAKTEGRNDAFVGPLTDYLSVEAQNMVSGNSKDYIDLYLDKYLTKDSYKTNSRTLSDPQNTLFLIWIGGNDFAEGLLNPGLTQHYFDQPDDIGGINRVVERTINNITNQISTLNAKGAYHFLIINLPDMGKLPLAKNTSYKKYGNDIDDVGIVSRTLSQIIEKYNGSLNSSLKNLQSSLGDKINIVYLDINHGLTNYLENKNKFDSTDFDYGYARLDTKHQAPNSNGQYIQDRCYKATFYDAAFTISSKSAYDFAHENSCKDAYGNKEKLHVFLDDIHPSSYTHCWIAYDIETALIQNGLISGNIKDLNSYKNYCYSKVKSKDLML